MGKKQLVKGFSETAPTVMGLCEASRSFEPARMSETLLTLLSITSVGRGVRGDATEHEAGWFQGC
jgi:hypothetical protein